MWYILSQMLMVGARKVKSYLERQDLISLFQIVGCIRYVTVGQFCLILIYIIMQFQLLCGDYFKETTFAWNTAELAMSLIRWLNNHKFVRYLMHLRQRSAKIVLAESLYWLTSLPISRGGRHIVLHS